jgi:GT2 family glycosyltransferase
LEFHAIVPLSRDGFLVGGALTDVAERLRSVRFGHGKRVGIDTIALAPRAAGSLAFLGLVHTPVDGMGLPFEILARGGKRFEGRVPEFGNLEPFLEFINTADVEKTLAWTAKLLADAGEHVEGGAAAKELESLLDAVMQRLESRPLQSSARVNAHVDAAERIGTEGLVLKGWVANDSLDPVASCAAVALSGARVEIALPLPATTRPDVVAAMANVVANPRPDCGFVAYAAAPASTAADSRWFLEVRLQSGAMYRCAFRVGSARHERATIEAIMSWAEDSAVDLSDIFARALDAPVSQLWRRTLTRRLEPVATSYGEPVRFTEISIVVPLYGRLDYLKHQIARFSNDPDFVGETGIVDLIYVLDDPRQTKDLALKARLAADIYGVPFRLVDLRGNYGFSTANNVGASLASGETLILLNSDVIPKRPGWASQLARTLKETENCGVLGCRLLYEDGSIQHAGMEFREAILLPGAWTNEHPAKGLPVSLDPHLATEKVHCVTGACLAIPRELYLDLGGLSDAYVIVDFEDSDLCLKAKTKGWDVYYTPDVELYHLERQSIQLIGDGRADIRQKLTLYNMWRHARTWRDVIARERAS